VIEWIKDNIPLIESIDNVEVNEAGYRFNLQLQKAVEVIDEKQLANEEAKNIFKELNEKAIKWKEAEELQLSSSFTSAKTADPILKESEVNMEELRELTKKALTEMDQIAQNETVSFEKIAQIHPEIFLTTTEENKTQDKVHEVKKMEKILEVDEFKEEVKKSTRMSSALSNTERKLPRTMIKAVNKPKKDILNKPIGIKQPFKYPKEAKRGILSMVRSNGFFQKEKTSLLKPGSKAKMKYEVARRIDSSLNAK
jgi:hypothetical protein